MSPREAQMLALLNHIAADVAHAPTCEWRADPFMPCTCWQRDVMAMIERVEAPTDRVMVRFMHYPAGREMTAGPFDFVQIRYGEMIDQHGNVVAEQRSRGSLWIFNDQGYTDFSIYSVERNDEQTRPS